MSTTPRERLSTPGRALAFVIGLAFLGVAVALGVLGAKAQLRYGNVIAALIGLTGTVPLALGAMIIRSAVTGRRVRELEERDAQRRIE